MTELEYKQYLSDINNRRKGGAKSSTPFSSEDGSQMWPSPTPVPPKVSATDVGQDESSFTQKAWEALNAVGSFWLGVGSGIGSWVANLAGYGADVASWLWQDVKWIFTWEWLGTQGAQALLWESQSEAGNAIRWLGSQIFDNEYGKMWTDSGAFGAWQTTGETGVWLLWANKLGLLKNPELGLNALKTVKWLGELWLKGMATTDITTQATEWRGATAWERLVWGWVWMVFPAVSKWAEIWYKLLPKKEITVLWNKITTWGGKTLKEYMADKTTVKSIEDATMKLHESMPWLSTKAVDELWQTAPIINKAMKWLKDGGWYKYQWKEITPREAFSIATDKTLEWLWKAKESVLDKSNAKIDIGEYFSPIQNQLDSLSRTSTDFDIIKKELSTLIKRNDKNPNITLSEFDKIRESLKSKRQLVWNDAQRFLDDVTGNNGMNSAIDIALSSWDKTQAAWVYNKLKWDMSKLMELKAWMPEWQLKSFRTWEDAASFTSEAWQVAYGLSKAAQNQSWLAPLTSAVTRWLAKAWLAAERDPNILFQKAFEFMSKSWAKPTKAQAWEVAKEILKKKGISVPRELLRQWWINSVSNKE